MDKINPLTGQERFDKSLSEKVFGENPKVCAQPTLHSIPDMSRMEVVRIEEVVKAAMSPYKSVLPGTADLVEAAIIEIRDRLYKSKRAESEMHAELVKCSMPEQLPDEKAQQALASMIQTDSLSELRRKILDLDWSPKKIKSAIFVIRNLFARTEKAEQENLNLRMSGMSEAEITSILSRQSILEKQVEVLGVERNCLNQVIRILASQGKIDPATEQAPTKEEES